MSEKSISVAGCIVMALMLMGFNWGQPRVSSDLDEKPVFSASRTIRDPFVPPFVGKTAGTEKKKAVKSSENGKEVKKESRKEAKEKSNLKTPPPYVLTGIVTGEKGEEALLFDEQQKASYLVKAGTRVGNYLITAILSDHVEMKVDSTSYHLLLKK